MSNLYRDLNKAAVDAKLSKNEFLIFNILMSQTIGFSKCSDPLTDARIANDTGIRLDRLRPALKSFLKRDIFKRYPHDQYQYEYCIADRFLDQADSEKIYPPSCAKSGEAPQDYPTNGGNKPAKRGHTTTNQTDIQKTPQQPTETTFTKTPPPQKKETDLTKKQPPQNEQDAVIEIFMAGLDQMPEQFVVQSSQAVRIEFSTQDIGNVAKPQPAVTATDTVTVTTNNDTMAIEEEAEPAQHTATMPIETELEQPNIEPEIIPEPEPAIVTETNNNEPEVTPPLAPTDETETHQTNATNQKTVVVVDENEGEKKPLELPKAIGEENVNACNRRFQTLSYKQQQRVLLVFYAMLKTGTIRSKANYFIGLCNLAKTDDLTVPDDVAAKQKRSKKQIAALEDEKKRRDLWSDYVCIQRFAQAENASEAVIAQRMGMEEAYVMYGQEKALCAA